MPAPFLYFKLSVAIAVSLRREFLVFAFPK